MFSRLLPLMCFFFFSSKRRHTRCALVTGVQTCALPICKWRPRSFDTLIGQDHVVRALTHALSTQRLHHAWLFTGTRCVGKTTLSRILAKSLNCETGITATPCGTCRADRKSTRLNSSH